MRDMFGKMCRGGGFLSWFVDSNTCDKADTFFFASKHNCFKEMIGQVFLVLHKKKSFKGKARLCVPFRTFVMSMSHFLYPRSVAAVKVFPSNIYKTVARAGFHMFCHLVEGHLKLTVVVSARTKDFPKQADFLMSLQLSEVEHLITAFVFTLVLDPLHQPGGDEGGGVAQVNHAGGALGHLSGLLPDSVSAGVADFFK